MNRHRRKRRHTEPLTVIIGAAVLLTVGVIIALLTVGIFKKGETPQDEPAAKKERAVPLRDIYGDGEMRGIWVATVSNINFPSRRGLSAGELRDELDAILTLCTENRLNTVLFQVRPTSDAFYRSRIFPTSEYLTGSQGEEPDGDFDVLAYLCAAAHEKNIAVFAWVNPLRVSNNAQNPLAPDNPAALHPEWCVRYGKKLWYDPGLPEVRELVADGINELLCGWDIDGVVFDDYFYPYPEDGAVFDDSASYARYGNGADLADWRRSNINALIRECYDVVSAHSSGAWFGVAPFGIWDNNNGSNGGSDTRGMSAYNDIYCDALDWIKNGYVDFISPQIYWSFDFDVAPFATLTDWWKNAVDGTNVRLFVSHAAYKQVDWQAGEMARQIEYARSVGCDGSIFYGYTAIAANENGVSDEISSTMK